MLYDVVCGVRGRIPFPYLYKVAFVVCRLGGRTDPGYGDGAQFCFAVAQQKCAHRLGFVISATATEKNIDAAVSADEAVDSFRVPELSEMVFC